MTEAFPPVVHHEPEQRFELQQDGRAGVLQYRRSGNHLVLVHTEVAPALEGKGIGAQLVRSALEYARQQDLKVVPRCSFASAYIRRHWREYGDTVDPAYGRLASSKETATNL
jgi:uncharacterized protein